MKNKASLIKLLVSLALTFLVFMVIKRLNVITLYSYGLYFFVILAIWFIIYLFLNNVNHISKRTLLFSFFTAFIISTCYIFGSQLEQQQNIHFVRSTFFNISFFAILLWAILCLIHENIQKLNVQYTNSYLNKYFSKFLIVWTALIILNIPYLILLNPGVVSPDSINILLQGTGEIPLHSGHPVFYTIIISLLTKIHAFLGLKAYFVVLSYSFLQILIMNSIIAYAIVTLHKLRVNILYIVFIFLYYALNPLFMIYNVSMWKDVLFGGMVALFSILLYFSKSDPAFMKTKSNMISLSLSTLGVLLFRTNGIAVVAVTFIFVLIILKEHLLKISFVIGIPIIIYLLFITFGFSIMNVNPYNKNEAFTIPYQHMARIYHDNKVLDEQDSEFFDKAFKTTELTFNPRFSDDIRKKEADIDYFANNTGEFFEDWFKLVKKYPNLLVKSFLNSNYGYWYPDTTNWKVMTSIEENAIVEIHRIGFAHLQNKLYNIFTFNILFNTINSIGLQYWILLIFATYSLINRRKETYLLYIPSFALWIGVMLATPVYAELRYVYGLYLILPFIIGINSLKNTDL